MDELMQEARRWRIGVEEGGGVPLRVNGGVAAGRIIFGAVGDGARLEYTVIGDAANLSAKLVKHNKALHSEALTTAETYELARSQGYEPPQPRTSVAQSAVAGVAQPLDVVIVA
jgi:adenylate cyclase